MSRRPPLYCLTLLHLSVRNIRIAPMLPAFLSGSVFALCARNSTSWRPQPAEPDLAAMLENRPRLTTSARVAHPAIQIGLRASALGRKTGFAANWVRIDSCKTKLTRSGLFVHVD